jgi:hypothetical protein
MLRSRLRSEQRRSGTRWTRRCRADARGASGRCPLGRDRGGRRWSPPRWFGRPLARDTATAPRNRRLLTTRGPRRRSPRTRPIGRPATVAGPRAIAGPDRRSRWSTTPRGCRSSGSPRHRRFVQVEARFGAARRHPDRRHVDRLGTGRLHRMTEARRSRTVTGMVTGMVKMMVKTMVMRTMGAHRRGRVPRRGRVSGQIAAQRRCSRAGPHRYAHSLACGETARHCPLSSVGRATPW